MALTDAAGGAARADKVAPSGMEGYILDTLRQFLERTDHFVRRQYREIIRDNPTPQQLEQHRRELNWAIWFCRLLQRVICSEQFADRALAATLEGRLRQLEESWKLLFEQPSKEEAERLDRLIALHFPDESRT